jgi:hypothetical protein
MIKNLIKFVKINSFKNKKIIEIEFLGKKQNSLNIFPWGLFGKPKTNLNGISFPESGYEDSLISMPVNVKDLDSLEYDELAIGIPGQKARIKFDKNNNIIITGQDGNSIIKLDKDGNLTADIKGYIDIKDKDSNEIKTSSSGNLETTSKTGGKIYLNGSGDSAILGTQFITGLKVFLNICRTITPGSTVQNATALTQISTAAGVLYGLCDNYKSTKVSLS